MTELNIVNFIIQTTYIIIIIILTMPRGRRNNNPHASYLEKLTVVELRTKCTRHGIKYMHVFKYMN